MSLVILDTETTGIDVEDKICQLCFCVDRKDGSDIEVYDAFVKPSCAISYEAMSVHHITHEMVEDAPRCIDSDVYKKLEQLNVSENTMVIHNCKFDLDMLAKEGFESKMNIIDTLRCVKHLYPDSPKSLQYLRYSLGLYKKEKDSKYKIDAHNALGDVLVLKNLLDFLLLEHSEDTLIKLTTTAVLYVKFPFGKYKGELIEDIVLKDINYINYLLNNNAEDPDLGYSLKYYIDKNKDKIVNRFNVGKYKGMSVDEISDHGYLSWAYENMTNMDSGLKQDIAKKIGKLDI
jgi:exodeoxyribonuclease X